jgi:hypothetical protein
MNEILETYTRQSQRATAVTYAVHGVHVRWVEASSHFTLSILDLAQVCGIDGSILDWQFVGLSYITIVIKILSSPTSSVINYAE